MKKIKQKVEAIREELKEPLPEPQNPKEKKMATKKKSRKARKKKGKGAKKVGAKKKAAKSNSDGITLKELADEAGISGQSARKKLRDAGIEREEGGRWAWKEGSKALKAARKAIGL